MFLWNVGIVHTVLEPRTPTPTSLPPFRSVNTKFHHQRAKDTGRAHCVRTIAYSGSSTRHIWRGISVVRALVTCNYFFSYSLFSVFFSFISFLFFLFYFYCSPPLSFFLPCVLRFRFISAMSYYGRSWLSRGWGQDGSEALSWRPLWSRGLENLRVS